MTTIQLRQAFVLIASAAMSNAALAQGSITFGPLEPTDVPVLSAPLLVSLALFIGVAAFLALRNSAAKTAGIGAILVGASALIAGGVATTERAVSSAPLNLITQQTQNFSIQSSITNTFTNNFSGLVQVIDITLPSGCPASIALVGANSCNVGFVVSPGQNCQVACPALISDVRLKADIVPVGQEHKGLPLYDFRYLDSPQRYRGVMAQDVLKKYPEAIRHLDSGFMAVDYERLGLEMVPVLD